MYLKDEHNITCKYTRFQTIGKSTFSRMEKYQNVFVGRAFSMSDNNPIFYTKFL